MHASRVYWVAFSIWLSIPLVVVNVDTGFAGEGFYDDFSDKNYADGDPQTWSSSVLYPNTNLDASTGDLVIRSNDVQVAIVDEPMENVSIRTQARLIAGWEIGVQARRVDRTNAGYSAGISQDGQLLIVREPGSVTLAEQKHQAETETRRCDSAVRRNRGEFEPLGVAARGGNACVAAGCR